MRCLLPLSGVSWSSFHCWSTHWCGSALLSQARAGGHCPALHLSHVVLELPQLCWSGTAGAVLTFGSRGGCGLAPAPGHPGEGFYPWKTLASHWSVCCHVAPGAGWLSFACRGDWYHLPLPAALLPVFFQGNMYSALTWLAPITGLSWCLYGLTSSVPTVSHGEGRT